MDRHNSRDKINDSFSSDCSPSRSKGYPLDAETKSSIESASNSCEECVYDPDGPPSPSDERASFPLDNWLSDPGVHLRAGEGLK